MNPRKRSRHRLWWLAVVCAADIALAGGSLSIQNGTVAGGGAVSESGPYRVISTIGEPAMGTISSGAVTLTSGYPATIGDDVQGAPTDGVIFVDGFED
jgi:hypothetical protein